MDIQMIFVGLIFMAALFYLGRLIYNNLSPKKNAGCGSNCKCGVDFSTIEAKKK